MKRPFYLRDVARNSPSSFVYNHSDGGLHRRGPPETKPGSLLKKRRRTRFDDPDLHNQRALLAFLEKDNAALEEQWKWAAQNPHAEVVMFGKAMMLMNYGQLHAARRLLDETVARTRPMRQGKISPSGTRTWRRQEALLGDVEEVETSRNEIPCRPAGASFGLNLALAFALAGRFCAGAEVGGFNRSKVPAEYFGPKLQPYLRSGLQCSCAQTTRPAQS